MKIMNFLFPTMCYIHFENECVVMSTLVNGLHVLELHESMRNGNISATITSSRKCSHIVSANLKHLCHLRLGHIIEMSISELTKHGFIDPVGSEPKFAEQFSTVPRRPTSWEYCFSFPIFLFLNIEDNI